MISFVYNQPLDFTIDELTITTIINKLLINENKEIGPISIVFGNDEWLLDYNKKYLNHDYFTDIITFDYTEDNTVSGDLLISLDRVLDNAKSNCVSRETELLRVCIHGVLHLCNYNDSTPSEKKEIREKEDFYLSLL